MIDRHFKATNHDPIEQDAEFLTEEQIMKWYTRSGAPLLYGWIIEDFIGGEMTIDQIAKKHHVTYDRCSRIIALYYCKPPFDITLRSRV